MPSDVYILKSSSLSFSLFGECYCPWWPQSQVEQAYLDDLKNNPKKHQGKTISSHVLLSDSVLSGIGLFCWLIATGLYLCFLINNYSLNISYKSVVWGVVVVELYYVILVCRNITILDFTRSLLCSGSLYLLEDQKWLIHFGLVFVPVYVIWPKKLFFKNKNLQAFTLFF